MTSRRMWMLGLALGTTITIGASTSAFAQVPRNFSYQGQLLDNNQVATGNFSLTINYYSAGSSTPLYTETFSNVPVRDGIFNVQLGSGGGFPQSMDFTEQYFLGLQVDGGAELQPRTAILAVPYALNANTVNGFSAEALPTAGHLLVLDPNGRVPASTLPTEPSFVAGNNVTISRDQNTNTYTVSSTGTGGITAIRAGEGLIGGGTTGEVTLSLAPNSITAEDIAAGAITGMKLSPIIAGEGLYQDVLGNLNVGVDNASIVIQNDRLSIGTIGASNLDGTIQRRINGVAPAGTFITGIGSTGTVQTATIQTDGSLIRSLDGNDVHLRINPAHSNEFTAPQNFGVVNATVVNTLDLNATQNIMLGGGSNSNITVAPGAGIVNFSGARIQNVGAPIAGSDAVNLDYFNANNGPTTFGGDVNGTSSNLQINTTNPGIGNRLITGVNSGTTTVNDPAIADNLTINGGTINNSPIGGTTPSTGIFTNLTAVNQFTSNGTTMLGDGTGTDNVTINAGSGAVDFSGGRLQNIANPVSNTDAVNLQTMNSSIASNNTAMTLGGDISGPNGSNTLNTANPGVGDRLVTGVNSGTTTVNDPAIADNLTINGGTINNSPIGATVASSGNFTTLNSTSQSQFATTSGSVVIGTATPETADALLEISRAEADDLLVRIYNTGAGGSELRVIGNSGVNSTLAFTDDNEYVSSINSNDATGLTFNVRDLTDPNSEAGLDAATAMTIERDGDVLINEDLTVLGAVNFGNGDDNLTFNSGTGTVDFSGSRLTNVADPIANMDAVNLQTLNTAVTAVTPAALAGDITGPNGSNTLDLTNPGIGDRLVTGVNSGTTTVNDPAIADDLTINGGTINNTPIGATTASTGNFTTLNSTSQTQLATTSGNLVVGTDTPLENDAIIQVQRAQAGDLLQRIYNTGTGGSELRLAGASGVTNTLGFTDDNEWLASVNANDQVGMTFNVRTDIVDPNSEAGLDAAVAMTIERDRDVVINEDLAVGGTLTVGGLATFNDAAQFNGATTFGNGDDNLTFNSGTGTVDFSGSRLTNVADPIAPMDAVNLQTMNGAITAATPAALAGDISGPNGSNTLNTANPGIGDRLVTGVNSGTTTINDPAINDDLTIVNGTVDNTPIGATTASTGNFTTLNSTSQTQVATTSGNLVVGTATPGENDAIIQVERAQAADLLQRIYNTGTGGAELRLAGASGVDNTLSFTDNNEWVSSITSNDAEGMIFNVRDVAETNDEATMNASPALTIERDRDVIVTEDLTVGGEMIANSAATGLGVSTRYSDTYVIPAPGGSTIVVPNTLVTPTSTVIVSYEANTGTTPRGYTVQTDATGSFTVIFDAGITAGDEIHYIIINH